MPSARREPEEQGGRRGTLRAAVCLSFSALLLTQAAGGLDPQTALTQYGHTAWRVRDGYFAGPPGSIAQTKDGFLWIGTDAGLIRFDGVRLEPGRRRRDRGCRTSGSSPSWGPATAASGSAPPTAWRAGRARSSMCTLRAGRFGALLEDRRGTIWAGHTRALTKVPPLCCFEAWAVPAVASSRTRTGSATSERCTRTAGRSLDRRSERRLPMAAGEPGSPDVHPISKLAALVGKSGVFRARRRRPNGGLLATGRDGGLWRLVEGRWTSHSEPPGIRSWTPRLRLSVGESGSMDRHAGEGLFRRVEGRTERFHRADGLSGDTVVGLCEDREGSVWVTTSSGLDRFRDVKVATLTATRRPARRLPSERSRPPGTGGVWISESASSSIWRPPECCSYGAARVCRDTSPTSLLEDSRRPALGGRGRRPRLVGARPFLPRSGCRTASAVRASCGRSWRIGRRPVGRHHRSEPCRGPHPRRPGRRGRLPRAARRPAGHCDGRGSPGWCLARDRAHQCVAAALRQRRGRAGGSAGRA